MATRDRLPYLSATALTQAFLDQCQDNLENRLEMIAEIETPDGKLYVSDRNKYVGERFYEARLNFPMITRTLGEWLSSEIEFSTVTLEINNSDGSLNKYLPSGSAYGGWIGKKVVIKLGLADQAATYRTIFQGYVTPVGGFKRSTRSLILIARDQWDRLNVTFPVATFTKEQFPKIENDKEGLCLPFILGDWTTGLNNPAAIPAFPVNGEDPEVYEGARNDVQCLLAAHDLSFIDYGSVYVKDGDNLIPIPSADIVARTTRGFSVRQNAFQFSTGNMFYVRCKGVSLAAHSDNIVSQAKYLLKTFGGLQDADFSPRWESMRDKVSAAHPQDSLATVKGRVWLQEPKNLLEYVLSLLEQVRLEAFVNADLKLDLNSLHLSDWQATPSHIIRNWDVERDSFSPELDESTNFNRAQAVYSYEPISGENAKATSYFRNQDAITQAGREITKRVVYPNLYVQADVENQLKETLKLASAYSEHISLTCTWRSILLDLGSFVTLNVNIGATVFTAIPAMIREIGYNPEGVKMQVKLWSFQMVPFPGWNPGHVGIVGGYNATIAKE